MCIVLFLPTHTARSKDNTWPEELIAVMKEMEKQELDQEKQIEREAKSQGKQRFLS